MQWVKQLKKNSTQLTLIFTTFTLNNLKKDTSLFSNHGWIKDESLFPNWEDIDKTKLIVFFFLQSSFLFWRSSMKMSRSTWFGTVVQWSVPCRQRWTPVACKQSCKHCGAQCPHCNCSLNNNKKLHPEKHTKRPVIACGHNNNNSLTNVSLIWHQLESDVLPNC